MRNNASQFAIHKMTHPQQIYDRERISLDIVRLKKSGKNFEVMLSDPNAALELRRGNSKIDVRDVLRAEGIFSDAKKGEFASENDLKAIFGSNDAATVAKVIIIEGDFHLTSEQKKIILDQKKNKIVNYIHMNAFDPKTNLPHPKQRIELAMEQAGVRINMHESMTSQTDAIVKKLQSILPMSFEKLRLRVSIPTTHASKTYSILKSNYPCKNEAWQNDGSVTLEVEIQAGKKQAIFDTVNRLTKGEAHITEVKI